jgi:hypothetical protein
LIASRPIAAGGTDDADGTDVFSALVLTLDHSRACPAFTSERDLDAQRPEERLRRSRPASTRGSFAHGAPLETSARARSALVQCRAIFAGNLADRSFERSRQAEGIITAGSHFTISSDHHAQDLRERGASARTRSCACIASRSRPKLARMTSPLFVDPLIAQRTFLEFKSHFDQSHAPKPFSRSRVPRRVRIVAGPWHKVPGT